MYKWDQGRVSPVLRTLLGNKEIKHSLPYLSYLTLFCHLTGYSFAMMRNVHAYLEHGGQSRDTVFSGSRDSIHRSRVANRCTVPLKHANNTKPGIEKALMWR